MKTLALFLLLVSSAYAQEVIPLGAPVWYDARIDPAKAAIEDGVFAEFDIQSNKLPNIHWNLPKLDDNGQIVEPDSIVFIVRGAAEIYAFSTHNLGDLAICGFSKAGGRVAFKYYKQAGVRSFRVGVAAHEMTRLGEVNVGGKGIDAAYAVYLDKTLGVKPSQDSLEAIREASRPGTVWYDLTGKSGFVGAVKRLLIERPSGLLFGPLGLIYNNGKLFYMNAELSEF